MGLAVSQPGLELKAQVILWPQPSEWQGLQLCITLLAIK
jgi:hypothetical protein